MPLFAAPVAALGTEYGDAGAAGRIDYRRWWVPTIGAHGNLLPSKNTAYVNKLHLGPFYLSRPRTVDGMLIRASQTDGGSTTPTDGNVRLGLYSSAAATGLPDARLYDSGIKVVNSSVTDRTVIVNPSVYLPTGLFYWALTYDTGSVYMSAWRGNNPALPTLTAGSGSLPGSGSHYVSASTWAPSTALPATITASDFDTLSPNMPWVCLGFAA